MILEKWLERNLHTLPVKKILNLRSPDISDTWNLVFVKVSDIRYQILVESLHREKQHLDFRHK